MTGDRSKVRCCKEQYCIGSDQTGDGKSERRHSRNQQTKVDWNGLPCPPPEDLPNPGIEPVSLCLLHWQAGSLPLAPPGKPHFDHRD